MSERHLSEKSIVLLVVCLSAFGMPVMLSATNVAIPIVADQFSLSATQIAWIPMSYLMASVMFVLISASMAALIDFGTIGNDSLETTEIAINSSKDCA